MTLRAPISRAACVGWQVQIRRMGSARRRVDSGDVAPLTIELADGRKVHVPCFQTDLCLRAPLRRIGRKERSRIEGLLRHGVEEVASVGEARRHVGDTVRVLGVLEREPLPPAAAGYRGAATRWVLRALPARGGLQVTRG